MEHLVLPFLRRSVQKRAGYDVDAVAPINVVANMTTPALFGAFQRV